MAIADATKCYLMKPAEADPKWIVIDADKEIVGRLAVRIATILMGKHKPTYTPHVACGDCVVVINADKVRFSGKPMASAAHPYFTQKMARKEYQRFSKYPGGQKITTGTQIVQKNPTFFLQEAVRRMLPKNKLRAIMMKRLKMYVGANHPHQAQQPEQLANA